MGSNVTVSEIGGAIIAMDSTGDLWNSTYSTTTNKPKSSLGLIPAAQLNKRQEYWAAALENPKGHFITFIATNLAFKHKWEYAKNKNSKESVGIKLKNLLEKYNRKYNIRQIHTTAVIIARIFGQSLVIKIQQSNDFYLRVVPIFPEQMELSDIDNSVIVFKPHVYWGNGMKELRVKPEDAVLYIHKRDPMGNGYTGISELLPVVRALTYEANMEYGYAKTMSQRGISALQIKVKNLRKYEADNSLNEKLAEYNKLYGNLNQHSVYITDENVEIEQFAGATAGWNLNQDKEAWAKEVAAATGMGRSRIDGSERGMAMGNIADRDNFHDILNEIQEENEPSLIEVYWKLIDASLKERFDIIWTANVQLDELTQAQVESLSVSTANGAVDFLTYNQILERFFKADPVPGGDIVASKYITDVLNKKKEKNENFILNNENYEDNIDPDTQEKKTENLKEIEEEPTPNKLKKDIAEKLLENGDSYRAVNRVLKEKFGTGMSFTDLAEIRRNMELVKQTNDSIDPAILNTLIDEIRQENPQINLDQARILAIKKYLGLI